MTPEEIAHSEEHSTRSKWHRDQRTVKLRYGTIQKWKQLATLLGLDENFTVRVMLDLTADFVINRRTWLSGQELATRLAPGAAAQLANLRLAENRNGKVVLLDVERTVKESLARRSVGLRALPAKRARDLGAKMEQVFEEVRGQPYEPSDTDSAALDVLRARAGADRHILERWRNMLLSNMPTRRLTYADLNRFWAQHAKGAAF